MGPGLKLGAGFEIFTVCGGLDGSSQLYRGNLAQVLSYEHHEASDVTVFGRDPAP